MSTINEMVTAAVAARKHSLKALRSRIAELLDPIPVGVVLSDDSGDICKIVRICTGASQWANCTWDVTIKGTGAITIGSEKLLCEIDLESCYWDGSNMYNRSSEPTCLYTSRQDERPTLTWLSGAETRALALRLPAAIERYINQCAEEEAANDATINA